MVADIDAANVVRYTRGYVREGHLWIRVPQGPEHIDLWHRVGLPVKLLDSSGLELSSPSTADTAWLLLKLNLSVSQELNPRDAKYLTVKLSAPGGSRLRCHEFVFAPNIHSVALPAQELEDFFL